MFRKMGEMLKNRLILDYLWVFLGQNLGSVFSTVSLALVLRIISSDGYGTLVVVQTYCLLISNLLNPKTFNAIIKYVSEAEEKKDFIAAKKYISTAYFFDISVGIIAAIVGVLLINPITRLMGWDAGLTGYIYMYMPVVLFYPILNGASVGILRKTGHFKEVNIAHATVYGVQLVVLLGLFLFRISGFEAVLFVFLGTEIAECIALIAMALYFVHREENYRSFWREGFSFNKEFIRYNFSFGLLSSFDQLLGSASTLLINKYIGNLATAHLKIITKICSVLTKLTSPIGQVIYPELCNWIARQEYFKALKVSKKYFCITMVMGASLGVILFATYDWWVLFFDEAMALFKWQSILYFVYAILSMAIICIHQLSYAINMMKINVGVVVLSDIVYIVALIPVIQKFGVAGYLILQTIQLLVVVGCKYFYLQHYSQKRVGKECE